MLFNKRYFNEFLKSTEGISTNILRDRLRFLEENGFLTKKADSEHKQKIKYSLTLKAIELLPILVEVLFWSEKQTDQLHPNRDQVFGPIKNDKIKGVQLFYDRLKKEHLK